MNITQSIQDLYTNNDPSTIRHSVARFFNPSEQEKRRHAEVSTPTNLVEEMLDTIPQDFWKTPKKVFEPCCGKGNFILALFDKFYKGLEEYEPDVYKRCSIIIKDCLYFSDISELNILITTELLKHHINMYCQ